MGNRLIQNIMRKNTGLLLFVLTSTLSINAQNITTHVGENGVLSVVDNSLFYNLGGFETKGNGKVEVFSNLMLDAKSPSDLFQAVDGTNANFYLRLYDKNNWGESKYGQLFITGFNQNQITAIINKEFASLKHGDYQQSAIPFFDKEFNSLNSELESNFNNVRWTKKEILKWNNFNVRFDGSIIPSGTITSNSTPGITINLTDKTKLSDRTAYYALGTGSGYNSENVHTITGIPFADDLIINLIPSPVNFGTNGSNTNIYREKYNTYISDVFEVTPFTATYGKNFHQFSNPFMTNIDLSLIGIDETLYGATISDENKIENIWGILINPSNVVYNNTTGTTSTYSSSQIVTFDSNQIPVGNVDALIVKPLGTFKIKLRDNTPASLNFDKLRRFNMLPRNKEIDYSVTANKISNNTVKQLGITVLDSNYNPLGETYYTVAPHFVSGKIISPSISSVQAITGSENVISTKEENLNETNGYNLYINEANELNYAGKPIELNVLGGKYLKFEIREDSKLVPENNHLLSTGKGFYIKNGGITTAIFQNQIIENNQSTYNLYYDDPKDITLSSDVKDKPQIVVFYNSKIENYVVRFPKNWKSANIEVYDASGKLIFKNENTNTTNDYTLNLANIKGIYFLNLKNESGEIFNAKLLYK